MPNDLPVPRRPRNSTIIRPGGRSAHQRTDSGETVKTTALSHIRLRCTSSGNEAFGTTMWPAPRCMLLPISGRHPRARLSNRAPTPTEATRSCPACTLPRVTARGLRTANGGTRAPPNAGRCARTPNLPRALILRGDSMQPLREHADLPQSLHHRSCGGCPSAQGRAPISRCPGARHTSMLQPPDPAVTPPHTVNRARSRFTGPWSP